MKKFLLMTGIIFFLSVAANFFEAEGAPEENVLPENFYSPWGYDEYKVGYVKGTGFLNVDEKNHITGYGYEYMEFLEMYAHCQFEYIGYESWNELVEAFQNYEVDMIPAMPGDYRKVPKSKRTSHVIGYFPMELVIKNRELKPHLKIGQVTANYPTPGFELIARSEGFTYDEIVFQNFSEMKAAYQRGEIDGYIDALLEPSKSQEAFALFDRQSYRLLLHEDANPEFYDRIDKAMDQMLLIQPSIRERLSQKYLRSEVFPLTLSREEREYLDKRKKIKAAIFIYYQPFAYHDESGNLVGLFPEIANKIAEDLGIEIEIIETHSIKETHDLIQSGGVDIVLDAILDHSWAENANIEVTQSYLNYEYVAATREGYALDITKNPRVAVVDRMLYTKYILYEKIPSKNIVQCDSWEECLQAVADGRADVTFILKSAIQPLMIQTGTYGIEISPMTYFTESCTLGVYAYENSHLWHILNKEVNLFSNTWIYNMLNKHIMATQNITPSWLIYHHPIKVIIFVALLSVAIGSFIIYRNRVQQRHFEMVQRMAYTDLRYDLPNVSWLEKEIPDAYRELLHSEPNLKTYFVIFEMESGAIVAEETGHKLIDKRFKEMANHLEKEQPVMYIAAGIDVEHLICFCKDIDIEEITAWTENIVKNYRYIDTADASARIVLHTRAGIAEYTPKIYIQQGIDRALSACHNKSNESVKVFDEKLEEQLKTRHNIESRMEQALHDGEFKAYYQPKYDLRTRKIIGAEALVRWISPVDGFMPPGKFIPLFEENGFVIQVDYYILEKTFQLQKERLEAGKEVVPISVNQSRLHMTEEGYLDKMRAIVEKYNLPQGIIELEITETMFGDFDSKSSQQNAKNIVDGLHELGFSLSVDDFGSGYSSFSLLGGLPMEVMKIDRSVLIGADTSDRMKEILSQVIQLGHALKMEVLCEGIETPKQENLLMSLGCYLGQGFLNAKPMPVEDFIDFFEKRNAEVATKAG